MTAVNGWTKWLVATLWGVLVMVIMFMGNVVRGNDLANRGEHTAIEQHSQERHEAQGREISKIEDIVTDIRIEQRSIAVELKQGLLQIEKKL